MPQTAHLQLRYPDDATPFDPTLDIEHLAEDVDTSLASAGTFAAMPAAGKRGRRYWATDIPAEFIDDGAAWQVVGGGDVPLRGYSEKVTTVAAATGATPLDVSKATVFDLTLTGNVTVSFTNPVAAGRASSFTLVIRQDATGGRVVTWPGSVKWPGGVVPPMSSGASKVDIVGFTTVDGGTTWLGFPIAFDMH